MAFYLPVAFFITYGMSVHYKHVKPLFPYISDTGTIPPESCLFAQFLNIYAALTGWCMYLRYKQVRLYYFYILSQGIVPQSDRHRSIHRKLVFNKVCLFVGIVTALGISVVGNFQEDHVISVHLLGAMMAFGGAGLYCWMQAVISYKMSRLPNSGPGSRLARVILSTVHVISLITMLLATKLSLDKFPGELKDIKKWSSSQPGYTEHLVATFAEWVMAFVSSGYFLTFVFELKPLRTKVLISRIDGTGGESGPEDDGECSTETTSPGCVQISANGANSGSRQVRLTTAGAESKRGVN